MKCKQRAFLAGYALYTAIMIAYVFAALVTYKGGAPEFTTELVVAEAIIMLPLPLIFGDELRPSSKTFMNIASLFSLLNVLGMFSYFFSHIRLHIRPIDLPWLESAALIADFGGRDPADVIYNMVVQMGLPFAFFTLAAGAFSYIAYSDIFCKPQYAAGALRP